jgi:hypothetical protein
MSPPPDSRFPSDKRGPYGERCPYPEAFLICPLGTPVKKPSSKALHSEPLQNYEALPVATEEGQQLLAGRNTCPCSTGKKTIDKDGDYTDKITMDSAMLW